METLLNWRLPFKEANRMVQVSIVTKSVEDLESSETAAMSLGRSSQFCTVKGKCHVDQ